MTIYVESYVVRLYYFTENGMVKSVIRTLTAKLIVKITDGDFFFFNDEVDYSD